MCGEFVDIEFGSSDADNEKIDTPNLLIEGYLDSNRYMDKILNERYFLVLGPKGSGKSAIGAKIQLLSESKNNLFSRRYSLKEFEYNEFDVLYSSREAIEIRYPNYWEFLLLLSILNSISHDHDAKINIPKTELKKVVEFYRKLKLLDDVDIGDLVKSVIKAEVQLTIPGVDLKIKGESKRQIPNREELYLGLKRACYALETPNQHILVIDDLDYVLTDRKRQYESLLALIIAANKINNVFREKHVKIKVVILCRTDIFDKLHGTNNTKIVTDSSIGLEWYQDVADIMETNIVKIINLRAKASLKREVNVFTEFFPDNFTLTTSSGIVNLNNLLTWTRHTPRDAIQLMNNIKSFVNGEIVTRNDIKNGLRNYALTYFNGEIRDELKGFISDDEVDLTLQLLSSMGYRNFRYSDLTKKIEQNSRYKKLDAFKLCNRLYECSAIGNYDERNGHSSWKYRNRHNAFDEDKIINVHLALAKSINISSYNPNLIRENTQDSSEMEFS